MNADRVLADLRELARLTGGPDGARRVCWTDEWTTARDLLRARLDELPVTVETDEAGNLWAELPGDGDGFVIVGSHTDSVPAGGWLDGALGICAALEAVRSQAEDGRPPVTLRLVDWADEEGARFGRSLFGSSACAGTLDPDDVRDLRDRDGERLEDVVNRFGVDLDTARDSHARLDGARAYLELHIEQGPVLESRDEPAATVLGTCGVERHISGLHRSGRPCGRDADGAAARLVRGHGAGRAGHPRDRLPPRRRLHGRRRDERARRRDRDRGPDGDAARPAPSRPREAGGDARRGAAGLRAGGGTTTAAN